MIVSNVIVINDSWLGINDDKNASAVFSIIKYTIFYFGESFLIDPEYDSNTILLFHILSNLLYT